MEEGILVNLQEEGISRQLPDTVNGTYLEQEEYSYAGDPCAYEQPYYVEERFWLVAVCGTTVAVISIIENTFLFAMLMRRKSYRTSHCLYLALLAFFDIFMAGAYIPLMSFNNLVDYYQSITMLRAWFAYMIPMITISHIAMTSSSFLIVAASFERYCVTVQPQYTKFLNRNRVKIAAGSVVLGVITKFTQALELDPQFDPACEGTMTEWKLTLSALANNEFYNAWWRIWFRNIFTVLLPFFLLAFMNWRIVLVIRRSDFHYLNVQKLCEAKRKQRVRAATRTLVLVVCCYLLSNVLNVIITIWEYISYESLTQEFPVFYLFAVDVVSLLTIAAGALRLPIYVCCQSQLRKEFALQIKKWCLGRNYRGYNQTSMTTTRQMERQNEMDAENDEGAQESPGNYASLLMRLGTALLERGPSEAPTVVDRKIDPLTKIPVAAIESVDSLSTIEDPNAEDTEELV